jgi:oligopeptide/dipeptide ABC transporter ATP-binding protein
MIEVRDLKVHFDLGGGTWIDRLTGGPARRTVRSVDGVSLDIQQGETLGLVGESGCGKTTFGRALLRLVPATSGTVMFRGKNLTGLAPRELRRERRHFQMIFQDPYASLDPRMSVGQIIGEPLATFGLVRSADEKRQRVRDLMQTVGLSERFINRYPHEFSGGQQQRIGIARALAAHPDFIVADEPISALDVSIQGQIVNLLKDLQRRIGLTYLFIAHDLSMVKYISDRVGVMYLGRLVEVASKKKLFDNPLHPYTRALLSSVPIPDPRRERTRVEVAAQGELPSPMRKITGCAFRARCPHAREECATLVSELTPVAPDHSVMCTLHGTPSSGDGA